MRIRCSKINETGRKKKRTRGAPGRKSPERWTEGESRRGGYTPRSGWRTGEEGRAELAALARGNPAPGALRSPPGPDERRRRDKTKAGGWPGLGPTRSAPRECQMWGNTSKRPQTWKGLPKVCGRTSHPEPPARRGLVQTRGPWHTSRPHPLAPPASSRRWGMLAAQPVAIPDVDARGRARVAEPRQVREERPRR